MENNTENELDCMEEETEVFNIVTHFFRQMQITCIMVVLVVQVAIERYYSRHQSRFTEPNPFQEQIDHINRLVRRSDTIGSTTVNKNDKSPPEPPKKKAKVSETLMTGLSELGDKLLGSLEFSASKFDMIGSRMGYQHDLSAKRGAVNEALKNLPLTVEQRITAGMAIIEENRKVDYFFSLTSDEEKMVMLKKLCNF
ncbi:hypothetical protein Vadar_019595 [Vaccinium darrowii]|uniref:Uncharacterized protein n=1 Tax=Vaccinium darrowii TaxID=229202 RepID=A0ACB7YN91_9ERIC|nr:hypothetical protein Vadar_019595 [Vaccinium darrowii]